MTCKNRNSGQNWARSTLYLFHWVRRRPRTLRRIGLRHPLRAAADKVDEHVLTEVLGGRVERPTAVQPGHVGDELREGSRPLQHERVDRDALLRAPLDLAEGLLDRPSRRRVVELDLAILEVRGRLAIRDDDDLLVDRRRPLEDPAREEQAVLEIRPVLVAVP